MKQLHFADLELLWMLLPLYLVWAAGWWLLARRRSGVVRFSSTRTLERLRPSRRLLARRAVQGLRLVTVALLILGMARPQTGRRQTEVRTEGIDIILVLDTSGSMQALDLDADRAVNRRRNRLEVSRAVVERFVQKRPNDQIGMVVFGSQAYTQCPLTLDHGVVAAFLERVEIGMAGDQGTAIGSALGTAIKRLRESEAESKVIILLTDGRNNAGALTPRKAAEIARTFDVKIYAIGVGTRGKAPFIVDSLFGKRVIYEDVEIDEPMLQEIAAETGGAYFRAEDGEALAAIYDEIDRMEKTEVTTESHMEYDERFRMLALPALGLLLLETLLLGTRLRKLP